MSRMSIVLAVLFSCLLAASPVLKAEDVLTEPILTFTGHTDYVPSAAYSPDGTKVLTGSYDYTARLWDAATGAHIRTFTGHTYFVVSVAFSPDGTKVLTGSWDKTARLWDTATGAHVATFLHTSKVNSVAFSPDGTTVLTASDDYTPRLWNMTGTLFTGHTGIVWCAAYWPDGTKVLTGSSDNTARLWDAATGAHIRTFPGHTGRVWCVAFSPDGAMVLTGSWDGTARMWDASTGAAIRTFIPYVGGNLELLSVAFSHDGMNVLTGSIDGGTRLWYAATGELMRTFRGPGTPQYSNQVNALSFSPDGTRVLTTNGLVAELWKSGPELFVSSIPIDGVSIESDAPGHTSFSRMFIGPSRSVTLTAPPVALSGAVRYDFIRWEIDGQPQPEHQLSVQLTVDHSMTAVAVYQMRKHTLAVNSKPVTGVSIGGGATDYSLVVDDQQTVNFSAPAGLFQNFVAYSFAFWRINGVPQPPRQTDIEVYVQADTTVEAVYDLFGDANGDCRVNILDMIFIRNRMGQDVATADNWRADLNSDGRINILDLIFVRNKLYSACP